MKKRIKYSLSIIEEDFGRIKLGAKHNNQRINAFLLFCTLNFLESQELEERNKQEAEKYWAKIKEKGIREKMHDISQKYQIPQKKSAITEKDV